MNGGTVVTAVAATGSLGTGYLEETLNAAVEQGADFIGADAGSSDPGPYFLGSGEPKHSRETYVHDLRPMLHAAIEHNIPLLIGSAGQAGTSPQLAWTADVIREIAKADDLHFSMAVVDTEQSKDVLHAALKKGAITPLGFTPPLTRAAIDSATHVTAQMGAEPFEEALRKGAQVVLAGRATDTAIFAAVPRMKGLTGGPTWHAAKVLECGAACVENRKHGDSMLARISADDFVISPPNPEMRCTPQSVAAHTLYENGDPFTLIEPGGILDTSHATYIAEPDGRSVRVAGSIFAEKGYYDVRLEGAAPVGYRTIAIGGIRDPLVIGQIDDFLDEALAMARKKIGRGMGLDESQYSLTLRVYGRDGSLGSLEQTRGVGHEVGVLIEALAENQERARGVCGVAHHTLLHHPIPQWSGLISNMAFPFSPPHIDAGLVYEFTFNHVMRLDDPLSVARIAYEDL